MKTQSERDIIDEPAAPPLPDERGDVGGAWIAVRRALSFRNISAIYVWIGLFVLFSLWVPDTFLTETTFRTLLNEQAIVAIVAVGLVVSLSAGAFDLSIGYTLGVGSIVVAWLIGIHDTSVPLAIALGIAGGTAVGVINAILITRVQIDSFIATLAVSSGLAAFLVAISNNEQIIGLPQSLQQISTTQILGVSLPVYFLFVIALLVWFVLEHTPVGRYLYATGGNPEAARLSGVPTRLVIALSLIAGSTIAGFAGVLLTARIGASSPDFGPSYLLPAFSAAFLGSTQIRNGAFNVWGTVIAVYVLATGVKGLQLAGAPFWLPDLFNCIALILAVTLAKWRGTIGRGRHSRLLDVLKRRDRAVPKTD